MSHAAGTRLRARRRCHASATSILLLLGLLAAGCGKREPVLQVSTSEMDFGSQQTAQSFEVKNAGEDHLLASGVARLVYDIHADQEWVTIEPWWGKCDEGGQNTHVVEIDRARLLPGSNVATLSINSNADRWSITLRADNGGSGCTRPPAALSNPRPSDDATDTSTGADLAWDGGDSQCSGLTATYDVYFGTASAPPLVRNNGTSKTWDPGTLAEGTTYYWKIVARDANGTSASPVWSFTTEVSCTDPPTVACNPIPADAATNVNENANLAWGCGDGACEGSVTYDVYFGTNPTPGAGEFLGNTSAKAWTLPRLQKNTTYYWRVVTKDANGTVPGPVWQFETRN